MVEKSYLTCAGPMLTIQTHFSTDNHPSIYAGYPQREPFVNLGGETEVLVRKSGNLSWETMRFGMNKFAENGLLSHAREDHLNLKARWAMAINRRVAVPICGYRWSSSANEWTKIVAGWALGIHEDNAFVLISAPLPENRPIVGSKGDADSWLTAKQWDAQTVLREVASAAGESCSSSAAAM